MTRPCYAPILKWKKGEQEALKNLTEFTRNKIIPLIEVTDYQEPSAIIKSLKGCFSGPVYFDTLIAAEDDREYLFNIMEEAEKNSLTVFPIIYYDDLEEQNKKILSKHIGVRIPVPEDLDGPSYSDIFNSIESISIAKEDIVIDLILDLGSLADKTFASRQLRETKDIIEQYLLKSSFYNLLVISSTSFPENISSVPSGGQATFPRYDFKVYEKIIQEPKFRVILDKIIYSDYGVTKFTDSDIDFSKIRYILPKIKYSTFDLYYVLKGQKNHKTRKTIIGYVDLSKIIYDSKYYFGEKFSFGDLEIKERALSLNKKGPGSNVNWVTIAANHHIAVVVEQLSKYSSI